MKFISWILLFSVGYATEYSPWFPPPWLFQGRLTYWYEDVEKVQTPLGSFNSPTKNSSLHCGLNVTPWPYWNVEIECFFTHTNDSAFAYEASFLTIRYAWLDDSYGDWISLATGATFSFPSERFLRQFSFDYHGNANAEFHLALGKEWAHCEDWILRLWGLGGCGIANRGSPWIHGLGVIEYQPYPCLGTGLYSEALYGLGSKDIIPNTPFKGYASINHQAIDIGGFVNYDLKYLGTVTLLGWYNIHAKNFISHYWGTSLTLLIPFTVF